MTAYGMLQILVFFGLVLLLTKPMGAYMARIFAGERTLLAPVLRPVERLFYRLFGVSEQEDMRWTTYSFAMLAFSVVGGLFTYALLRLQGYLPLNPQHFTGHADDAGPVLQHGDVLHDQYQLAELLAGGDGELLLEHGGAGDRTTGCRRRRVSRWPSRVVRGFARHSAKGLGNFWVDITRATLYVLLPICLDRLADPGVAGRAAELRAVHARDDRWKAATQVIAQGPVASQESIKMLGTNGGGFFNANSAHPYENPTPLTNLLEMLSIFLIPAGLTYTFGQAWSGNTRQGWAIFAAMAVMFLGGAGPLLPGRGRGNPNVAALGVMAPATADQPGGNMEGKETRFGIAASALCSPRSPPTPPAARSTRCTTASPRSAARCRWST